MFKFVLTFVIGLVLFALIPAKYIPSFYSGLHTEAQITTEPLVDGIKKITGKKQVKAEE